MDKEYHFFLWIKKECPFCINTINTLLDGDYNFTTYKMDNKPEVLQQVKNKFNWQTVPIILVQSSDGETKFIGGYNDLEDFLTCLESEERGDYDLDEDEAPYD